MALTDAERSALEAKYTARRIVELQLDPVRGNFDAAHLREINRRIFQDLPGHGLTDVTSGQYRAPVPEGRDWLKMRALENVKTSTFVAYSRMDESAVARLDALLDQVDPKAMSQLDPPAFSKALAELYTQLDYIHPFPDGNSRTLRVYTGQLAEEAGYALDWTHFTKTPYGRDQLYIARDLGVNALALPHVQSEATLRKILFSSTRFEDNRQLPALMADAIKPLDLERRLEAARREAFALGPVRLAEPGRSYAGIVLAMTEKAVLQATPDGPVEHLRHRLVDHGALAIGKSLEIRYPHGGVGLVADTSAKQFEGPAVGHQVKGPQFGK
ncbi:Fic family protein [Bordetella sp. FB-8]|uniref:Fic family protein n=1 Tax=Bordetella sp. FB-8 TaxID=1159870 RepID=UPI000379C1D9|nr:Fic family protein [Bordetella sp. FB-8]